jgi:hypothetical protein
VSGMIVLPRYHSTGKTTYGRLSRLGLSNSAHRTPMTSFRTCPIPVRENAEDGLTYLEGMYHLNRLISQRLNPDAAASASYTQILDNCQEVESIRSRMSPRLKTKESCKSELDRLQFFAIRLHTSFVMSVCCRPALKRDDSRLDSAQKNVLAKKCKENLTETVRMFLAMHQLSVIPTRSWAFTYHGLSSALLLGILGETKADPEVRSLQGDLISALSATAAKDQTESPNLVPKSDKDIELSGPLSRALTALKTIYDHGAIVMKSLKMEDGRGSGSRTPLQFAPPPLQLGDNIKGVGHAALGALQQGIDPHQDAALAMAEMQNGSALTDFSGYVSPCLDSDVPIVSLTNMKGTSRTWHPYRAKALNLPKAFRRPTVLTCPPWISMNPYSGVSDPVHPFLWRRR